MLRCQSAQICWGGSDIREKRTGQVGDNSLFENHAVDASVPPRPWVKAADADESAGTCGPPRAPLLDLEGTISGAEADL